MRTTITEQHPPVWAMGTSQNVLNSNPGAPRGRLTLFDLSSIFWREIRQNPSKSVNFHFFAVPQKPGKIICHFSSFWLAFGEWVIFSGRKGFASLKDYTRKQMYIIFLSKFSCRTRLDVLVLGINHKT